MGENRDDSHHDGPLDAALLAEIEQEFAELTAEIEKINALPALGAPEKAAMIETLRTSWHARHENKPERPQWRKTVDQAVDNAVDAVLRDSVEVDVDGNVLFNLKPDALGPHGKPLMNAAAIALRAKLTEMLPGVDLGDGSQTDPGKLLSETLMAAAQAFLGKGLQKAATGIATKRTQSFSFKVPKATSVRPAAAPSPTPESAGGGQRAAIIDTSSSASRVHSPAQPSSGPAPQTRASGPDLGHPAAKPKDPDAIQVKIDLAGLLGALMNPNRGTKKKTGRGREKTKSPRPKKP